MRLKPSLLEKLALALRGEPTDTRRQTKHVEDRRGRELDAFERHEIAAALQERRRQGSKRGHGVDPATHRAFLKQLSRLSRQLRD